MTAHVRGKILNTERASVAAQRRERRRTPATNTAGIHPPGITLTW
jgi:hypothetical protein